MLARACLLAGTMPGAALADLACRFEVVCFMAEPCVASDWAPEFTRYGAGYRLATENGPWTYRPMAKEDGHMAYFSGPNNGAVSTLTRAEDGTAIYSEQALSGGFSVTETGFCREVLK